MTSPKVKPNLKDLFIQNATATSRSSLKNGLKQTKVVHTERDRGTRL